MVSNIGEVMNGWVEFLLQFGRNHLASYSCELQMTTRHSLSKASPDQKGMQKFENGCFFTPSMQRYGVSRYKITEVRLAKFWQGRSMIDSFLNELAINLDQSLNALSWDSWP